MDPGIVKLGSKTRGDPAIKSSLTGFEEARRHIRALGDPAALLPAPRLQAWF
jgi:hypothetical protein